MNNYFDSNNKKDCNGCGTCALKCPKCAISMKADSEGFLYPIIDREKCVNCGICKKICSNQPRDNKFPTKVYAAKNKNNIDRQLSTSGGMFKVLAKNIILKNGVVFGVKYNNNLEVIHDYAETLTECQDFSISKYVRSNLNNSYRKVEKFLKEDRYVLFSGTPCQNYGLKKYLGRDYEKLILCEIICHSNPSPKVFELYKKNIEKDNKKKISYYYFRSKNKKPYVLFKDGTTKEYKVFNTAFNSMLISRPSCSNCMFCDTNRKSDITIGDFWGIEKYHPKFVDNNGISLLCINSKKGAYLFEEIKNDLEYKESNIKDAFKYNHNSNIMPHKSRKKFFNGISNGTINENNIIHYMKKYTHIPIYRKVGRKIKLLLNIKKRHKSNT